MWHAVGKQVNLMDLKLIYEGKATLEDLYELHDQKGLEFIVEGGVITNVYSG
jgi:hypothetical protein